MKRALSDVVARGREPVRLRTTPTTTVATVAAAVTPERTSSTLVTCRA
jgi:hypothetical protein